MLQDYDLLALVLDLEDCVALSGVTLRTRSNSALALLWYALKGSGRLPARLNSRPAV